MKSKPATGIVRMLRNPVLLLVACTTLAGCLYASSSSKQETFSKSAVKKIEPGRTTKEEILKWFGPPLAIAHKGDGDKIITVENVRADTFLELFSAKHPLTESDVVYYYRNVETTSSGGVVVFVVTENNRSATSKLWVLINNRNGIVEDIYTSESQ